MRSLFPALWWSAIVALAVATVSGDGGAAGEPPRATAKIECAHAPEPGRVRCEVETRSPAGATLRWADVVVSKTPPFATALRGRVGPLEATVREETVWRWAIALAARGRGTGEIAVRVRLVACVKDVCAPQEIEAHGEVAVGEQAP